MRRTLTAALVERATAHLQGLAPVVILSTSMLSLLFLWRYNLGEAFEKSWSCNPLIRKEGIPCSVLFPFPPQHAAILGA